MSAASEFLASALSVSRAEGRAVILPTADHVALASALGIGYLVADAVKGIVFIPDEVVVRAIDHHTARVTGLEHYTAKVRRTDE